LENDIANLPNLIRFGVVSILLEVHFFKGTGLSEYVVTASYSHFKPEMKQQIAQIVERDIGVASSLDDPRYQFLPFSMGNSLRCWRVSQLLLLPEALQLYYLRV
jgi:hypothetical protein